MVIFLMKVLSEMDGGESIKKRFRWMVKKLCHITYITHMPLTYIISSREFAH